MTVTDLRAVQAEVRKGRWRENSQAKDWVGIAVARVLKLDPKDKTAKAKIRSLMKTWIEKGMFAVVMVPDENSDPETVYRGRATSQRRGGLIRTKAEMNPPEGEGRRGGFFRRRSHHHRHHHLKVEPSPITTPPPKGGEVVVMDFWLGFPSPVITCHHLETQGDGNA